VQGLWYGDRRDRVKWGALLHLAHTRGIQCIVQVAYYRHGEDPILQTPEGEVPLSRDVWNHFSDLRHIGKLGEATGISILVFDDVFNPPERRAYVAGVVRRLNAVEGPKIVFLDPDTGVIPGKAGPEHVTTADLAEIWSALLASDVLVVYQHADRTGTWREDRAITLSQACGGVPIKTIVGEGVASDVAMLYCEKLSALAET
jgi:hypothetical protein